MYENVVDASQQRRCQKEINVERWSQQCPTTGASDVASWKYCAKNNSWEHILVLRY
jgi:hypothetical protein